MRWVLDIIVFVVSSAVIAELYGLMKISPSNTPAGLYPPVLGFLIAFAFDYVVGRQLSKAPAKPEV